MTTMESRVLADHPGFAFDETEVQEVARDLKLSPLQVKRRCLASYGAALQADRESCEAGGCSCGAGGFIHSPECSYYTAQWAEWRDRRHRELILATGLFDELKEATR